MNLFLSYLYLLVSSLLILYFFSQLHLFILFLKKKKERAYSSDFRPGVTVQLPLYNEKYVVERLLKTVTQFDYPLFEIQVLDDSNDESLEENRALVTRLRQEGYDIVHIHRKDRKNFKAGALEEALKTAKYEFIVIFDADFMPSPDWLKKVMGYFVNKKLGMVQTRWGHLNAGFNALTQVQSLALDHHFVMEQTARNRGQHFINFNGTAGVWRKSAIQSGGNWQGDTLTEDLDLSLRVQQRNWEFYYLPEIMAPAELPMVMSALKSQQYRWNKGGAQNFKKHMPDIWKNPKLRLSTKLHAWAHLQNSTIFVWSFVLSLLSIYFSLKPDSAAYWLKIPNLLLSFSPIFLIIMLYIEQKKIKAAPGLKFLFKIILFFPLIFGLSFHNATAVISGYLGQQSDFIRTPKFKSTDMSEIRKNNYRTKKVDWKTWIEITLGLCFLSVAAYNTLYGDGRSSFSYAPYHMISGLGYLYIGIRTLNE